MPVLGLQDPRGRASRRCRRPAPATASCRTMGPQSRPCVHEVDGGPADLDAVLQGLALRRRGPGNAGSSDGCTFRMRPGKAPEEAGGEQPHVAGQADQIDAVLAQELGQLRGRGPRAAGRGGRGRGRGSRPPRARSRPGRAGHVRDHDRDRRRPARPPAAASMQGLQVGAAAADEDADALATPSRSLEGDAARLPPRCR